MKKLHLSTVLSLPLEVVTQKLAWLGVTGSGKTYGASKLAELMWDAGAQFVVFDPVGVWYGLRLAKDGKRPSDITIPIFGGLHGDVPLEPASGAMIANLIVDRGISVIIDVSQFESDAQKARFATDFADRFFFRKKAAPSAVHLFIEEAQEFCPQNTMKGEERMLHSFTRLQKLGRNFGIGSSYITQRPQEVNKKALNMAQTLFVFRCTGVKEREAIKKWIEDKSLDQDIAGDLPKLPNGDAHVWSPEWLAISEVVHIYEKRTFNASSTPEVGVVAKARELAPIDLEKIRTDMAATIEKAKASDPDELRKEIAKLRRELIAKPTALAEVGIRERQRIKSEAQRETRAELEPKIREMQAAVREMNARIDRIGKMFARALKVNEEIAGELLKDAPKIPEIPATPKSEPSSGWHRPLPQVRRVPVENRGDASVGNGGLRRILVALAQRPQGLSNRQIGVRAGLSSRSGTFSTYVGTARSNGWVEGRGELRITDAGMLALGNYNPLPSGRALLDHWIMELGSGGASRMLRVLADVYPESMSNTALGEAAGISAKSGTFSTYLSKLRALELVTGRGELKASEEFFE